MLDLIHSTDRQIDRWMDGSERSSLTVLTAQSAHSLTADVAARRLYWISDFKKVSRTFKGGVSSICLLQHVNTTFIFGFSSRLKALEVS